MMCSNVRDYIVSDTKYEYQYLYKYPEKTVPEGGEAAYIETLSTDCMGYTLDVTVLGIDGKSKYFDARPEKGYGYDIPEFYPECCLCYETFFSVVSVCNDILCYHSCLDSYQQPAYKKDKENIPCGDTKKQRINMEKSLYSYDLMHKSCERISSSVIL